MEGAELIADALGRINRILHRTLDGVPVDVLNKRPTEETNSMSWLAWHLTRVQDHHISDLVGKAQLWVSDGWAAKFGKPADETETGTGHTPEQVAAVKVESADVLLGYTDAVYERGKAFLATVKPEDLDKEIDEPQYNPLPTVGVRLVSIVMDNTQHAGQVAYLKGLFQGKGWMGV
jgi:uncharacterized damage-inducible protein DinB